LSPADSQPNALAPGQPRRGLTLPVKATLTALLLPLLLGPAALPWWLSNPQRLSRIIAGTVPELAADITFENVRLGWIGPIALDGAKLVPRDGGQPPITIERVEGSRGLLAMLLSVGDLGRLTFVNPSVDLVIDEDHHSNLERLLTRQPSATDAAAPRAKRSPLRMRLAVDGAVMRITAPWTTDPWVSEPISLRASLTPVQTGSSEWTIEPVTLLDDASMDPPVAWGVLAYAAPVLADTTRSSGRFSLVLDGARFPVGDPAAGTLSGTLTMHKVVVGPGPLVENLLRSLPGEPPPPPEIRIAEDARVRFQLADRRMRHEGLAFGLPLPGGRRLDVESSGTVGLDDDSLDVKLVLPIPADLPQDRPLLAALSGKTLSLGVVGKLGEPEVVFDGSISRMAGDVARDLLERARGGPAATDDGTTTGEDVVDVVGGVIDEIARRRAARRAADQQGDVAPRRERLRDRILRPAPVPPPETKKAGPSITEDPAA